MFEYLKRNVDAETIQKLKEKLNTPEGRAFVAKLNGADKEKMLSALGQVDMQKIDFNQLNAALKNADIKAILNNLNGGAGNGR